MQVGAGEEGVVVEHLLEVGDRPGRVDAVAREPAAQLVIDAAGRHRAQGLQRHVRLGARCGVTGRALAGNAHRPVCVLGAAQQQELDDRRLRELRRPAKAAVARVERGAQSRHGLIQRLLAQRLARGCEQRAAGQPLAQPLPAGPELLAALRPRLADRLQHLRPGGHAGTGVGRE